MRDAPGPQTRESRVRLELEPHGVPDGTGSVGQHSQEAWNTLSVLASECAHVVSDVLPGNKSLGKSGHVEHESHLQRSSSPQCKQNDPSSQDSFGRQSPELDNQARQRESLREETLDTDEVVRSEAAKVGAKFASVDASTEVVLRFDFMDGYDTKVASGAILIATLVGTGVLIAEFTEKMSETSSTARFKHKATPSWNIAIGCVCLVLMSANLGVFAWRVLQARRQKKSWKTRRKRNATLFFIEAAVQWVNLVFYIIPNVYLLLNPCYFFGYVVFWCGWVRWTCWNTLFLLFLVHANGARTWKKAEGSSRRLLAPAEAAFQVPEGQRKLYMDGPWRLLWPCLIPWILMQAAHSVAWLRNAVASGYHVGNIEQVVPYCQGGGIIKNCRADRATKISIDMMVAVAILYFAVTCTILMSKLRQYKKLPYAEIQVAVVFYRLQLRLRAIVMTFFGLSLILLWIVKLNSCASFQFSWLGLTPMQVVMTANAFVWSYIAMPHTPQEHAVAMRVWEQEFAWTEADKPIKIAARALTVPNDHKLNKQPIFCFETMMHMLYWSSIVYDYKRGTPQFQRKVSKRRMSPQLGNESTEPMHQAERTTLSLRVAMGLYNLTDSELFWELQLDTRCLMGWSKSKIVVAFRGTASMTNALSDLQAWRVTHPPARGHKLWCTHPLVHVGFMKSWLAGSFNEKVINRIMEIVNSSKPGSSKLKIYVTGHSMGGALATLAAYDIRKRLQKAKKESVEVMCYSFGAPRTGNHAFARDYNHVVPDTWSIINDQDVVTRGAKFLVLYKRPGKRVIVNDLGRLIVSPSSIEASIQQSTAGHSMDHHLLISYHHAILSTILAQFSPKGFLDGMAGIVKLVESSPYLKSLLEAHMGMPLDAMRQFSELSPAERGTSVLPGAHMPSRGFYRIRSVTPGQLDRQRGSGPSICGIPFWVSSRSEAAVSAPLGQGSLECEIGSGGSVDTSVVGDIEEEVAHGRAHMGIDMGELKAPVDT